MGFAYPMQKIQDWVTQQWVILMGRKIDPEKYNWLMGPFGNLEAIHENYIPQLAQKENLIIDSTAESQGLIPLMKKLNISTLEYSRLSPKVIDFYENTTNYKLNLSIHWNPFFKFFGILLQKLFSNRLNQLNIPTQKLQKSEWITSEIVTLLDADSRQMKYVFWLRTLKSTGHSVYSGAYGICHLPSGKTCVKAVFPLPNGNATVIMIPKVGTNGELILESSGQKFGDAGFYFLLKDSKNKYWSHFIRSFRDELVICESDGHLVARQTLTLWGLNVLKFNYVILLKSKLDTTAKTVVQLSKL